MAVTLKEFNSIRDYIQSQIIQWEGVSLIPEGSSGAGLPNIIELVSYEAWMEQRKPKKEKKEQ